MALESRLTKCSDQRCIFDSKAKTLQSNFRIVTTETREGVGLWESCENCGLIINRCGVTPTALRDFYNSSYQERNSFATGRKIDVRDHFNIRLESIKPRAEYLSGFVSKDSIVFELGAGSGELLALLKPKVGRCFGNELCREFVDFMNHELGISASDEDYLSTEPSQKWDLAISIGTLDHLNSPREYLEKLFDDIKHGGRVYLEVPNDEQALKSFLPDRHTGSFSRFMYQAAHYYSFTFNTLRSLLAEVGFTVEDEFSRHDYSLLNYLNWCMTGGPQSSIVDAKSKIKIFSGNSGFETEMNELLCAADERFHEVISRHKLGESICMLARKPS